MRKNLIAKRQETDYYKEISAAAVDLISDNLSDPSRFSVKPVLREIGQGLRQLLADGYDAGPNLRTYIAGIPKLQTDFSIFIENKLNAKFEIIIFEIKLDRNLGLSELAQLIGYCLVSRCRFGVLVNVGEGGVSADFSKLLQIDQDLTTIDRVIRDRVLRHEIGIMIWNTVTRNLEYTQLGAIKSVPELVGKIETALS